MRHSNICSIQLKSVSQPLKSISQFCPLNCSMIKSRWANSPESWYHLCTNKLCDLGQIIKFFGLIELWPVNSQHGPSRTCKIHLFIFVCEWIFYLAMLDELRNLQFRPKILANQEITYMRQTIYSGTALFSRTFNESQMWTTYLIENFLVVTLKK